MTKRSFKNVTFRRKENVGYKSVMSGNKNTVYIWLSTLQFHITIRGLGR